METFNGKLRRILYNGKRLHIARSHSIHEIDNEIKNLKVGDLVLCSWHKTIRKI